MTNWKKFDKEFDTNELQKEIAEAAENSNSGDYEEVPTGEYEVEIEKLELTESKKGDAMLSVWFNILEGKYANSKLFMNQVVTEGFQFHLANEFLQSLDTGVKVKFETFSQYANMIDDVFEKVDAEGLQYLLKYSKTKKGYPRYTIEEVYED